MGENRNAYRNRILVGKTGGTRPLGWAANSRVDLRKRILGGMDWRGLTQGVDRWETLVSTALNLLGPPS
jgi:hypothetical protein